METEEQAPPLYRATVPVFLAVLDRVERALALAEARLQDYPAALAWRPSEGMLSADRQVATMVQFMLRIALPLAGQRVPELRDPMDGPGLRARIEGARALLTALDPAAFAGAETRVVRVQAGLAHLELPAEAFVHGFGLPNVYFHQAMAHVALKQAGAPLGKAHFDGLHAYPEGFTYG